MHAENGRSGRCCESLRLVSAKRHEDDPVHKKCVQGVKSDVEQVVAERIGSAEVVVQAVRHEQQSSAPARKPKHITDASDIHDSGVLQDKLLVIEDEFAVKAVGIGDRSQGNQCERQQPGFIRR